jgi:Transposase domain (DUF772)
LLEVMSGGISMRPRERRESGEQDLFRSRLDQVINMDHALVKLARAIDWGFLEEKFGTVYNDGAGQPPLPTRLMAGLAILKHTYNLSDEVVCELWIENPYYQYFCGEEFFRHRLPLDRSSMTRWRNRMGGAIRSAGSIHQMNVTPLAPKGVVRIRLPVAATIALPRAEHIGIVPTSPKLPGSSPTEMISTEISGAWSIRRSS